MPNFSGKYKEIPIEALYEDGAPVSNFVSSRQGSHDPLSTEMHSREEIRVVDPETGAAKGTKLARFDLVPAQPLWELAELYGRGADKYGVRNWEAGYAWSLSFAAMLRHAISWWQGEDYDPKDGQHHLAAVAWHAFALQEFQRTHKEKDDRPK